MKRNVAGIRRQKKGAAWRNLRRRHWENVCCSFCMKAPHLKGRFGRSETFRCTARNKALKDQAEGY